MNAEEERGKVFATLKANGQIDLLDRDARVRPEPLSGLGTHLDDVVQRPVQRQTSPGRRTRGITRDVNRPVR